ncbi:MAG: ABC transporter permease [Agriterribacter sp.]
MFKNYIKIAWRNIARNRSHAIINVTGLAIGIAASLLIFIVVKYELSFDAFQKNYNCIYRIVTGTKHIDGSEDYNSGIPCPAYDALKVDFPQLKNIVAVNVSSDNQFTVLGNNPNSDVAVSKKFIEEGVIAFTSPDYFTIFNAAWLSGSAASLKEPNNIVLSKAIAKKYFGDWSTAGGQFLKLDNTILLKVSGIVDDMPDNSDFPIRAFISYETFKAAGERYGYSLFWGSISSNHQIYITLPEEGSEKKFEAQLKDFTKKHFKNAGNSSRTLIAQPMSDFHFNDRYPSLGDHSTSKPVLWTLSFIGVLIIVMASINFVNLATAQAVGRSKEVGIRKVLGGSRSQLVRQVMGETFLTVLLSLIAAIIIAWLTMPWLSAVSNTPAGISLLTGSSVVFLFSVLVSVTLLSGAYPALIVSGFKPVLALKSKINAASIGGVSLRRVLVVTQFAISQVLIIGTIIAVSQMNYVRSADLGFNKEAVMVIPVDVDSVNLQRMVSLKNELLKNPSVISVSFASDEASSENNWASNFAFDHKEDAPFPVFSKYADDDYLKTFGLQLLAGRGYNKSDTVREFIINETLAKRLGVKNLQDAVGKDLRIGSGGWFPVVGIVKDFTVNSLREEVKPIAIASYKPYYYTLNVKLNSSQLSQTAAIVQHTWEATFPEYAFTSHFSDETVERFYKQENKLALLYKIFAAIAIFISCLGLYGLVSYMAVQKTKEVGIRKVLGASITNIVILFSREFTVLISLAFIIAVPVGWYVIQGWLQNFAYRVDIGIGVFLLAIVLSLIIAWLTVGYKAVGAALANPVKALRSE